jgi:hypothetical protein
MKHFFDRIEGLNGACLGVKTPLLDGQRAIFDGFYTQNRIKYSYRKPSSQNNRFGRILTADN